MFTLKQREELSKVLLDNLRKQGVLIPLEADANFNMYMEEMMKQVAVYEDKYRKMWPLKTPLPDNVWTIIIADIKKK
jgi:hypothetical protein